jgi:hypothetical protein
LFIIINKLAAHTGELFLLTSVCFYLVNALCSFELDELEHKLPHVCMAFIMEQYVKQITDLTACKGIFFSIQIVFYLMMNFVLKDMAV